MVRETCKVVYASSPIHGWIWSKYRPRQVLSIVSCMCTDQTRENYQCKLISFSQARVETELTSDSVEPSRESSESIFK